MSRSTRSTSMRRSALLVAAAAVAVVPAVLGVAGNATFSQRVPAVIPAGASVVPPSPSDDAAHTSRLRTGTGTRTADDATSRTPRRGTTSTSLDDRGSAAEPGDDSGGHGGRSGGSGSGGSGSGGSGSGGSGKGSDDR